MPKILESEALVLANSIDAAAPEDRPWMLDVLTRYQSQQFDNGDPEWPTQAKQQAEAETRFRSMFDAPEKVPYDPGPYAKDPNAERASYANAAFIANRYNVEFGEAVDRRRFYMDDYAAKKGQKSGLDEMAFYNLAKGEVVETKLAEDTRLEGAKAALRGEDVIGSLQAWQGKNLDRLAGSTDFTKGYLKAKDQAGDYLPMADELLKLMESQTGQSNSARTFDTKAASRLDELAVELAGMKPRERKQVYASIAARSEMAGYEQKGFWSQMLGELDKGLLRMSSTVGTTAGNAADVMRNFPAMLAEGATGNRDFGMKPGEVANTDETIAQRQALGEIHDELASIVSGTVDPVRPTIGWLNDTVETGLIKGPGAVMPFMAATAALGPWGGGMLFTADFAEQNRRDLRAAGMDNERAIQIGTVAAPLQAAVESLSNMLQLGKFTKLQSVLANFTKPIGGGAGLALRYAQNTGISLATEYTEEQLQDNFIVPAVQEIVGALAADVPEVDWSFYKTRAAESTPELLSVLAPMALVFGGVMTGAQANLSREMTSNIDALKALNYSEAQATEIVAEKTEEGRIAKASSMWGVRAGDKTTLEEGARSLSERMRQLSGDVVAQQQDLERRGILPRMLRATEDQWRLTFQDGSTAAYNSHAEADAARWTWTEDQLGKVHALTRETLSSMERNLDVKREIGVEFSPDARTAQDAVNDGVSVEQMSRRVKQGAALGDVAPDTAFDDAQAIDKATADSEGFLSSLRILGSSRNEFKDGVLRTTIRLWEGSNVLTLVEEKLEGDAKAIISERRGRDWMLSRLRSYEETSGDKLFRDVPDEQLKDDDIIEAWSHLGQSYLVGRSTFGEPLQAKTMRRFGRLLMRAGFTGAMNSEASFFAAVASRAKKLGELQKAGKLGADLTAELEKQLGIDSQVAHDAGAEAEARQLIDTSGYSEETPGPNGETFSISSKELRVKIEVSPDSTTLGNLGITEGFHANHGGEVVPDFAPRASKQGRKGQYAGFYLGPAINEVSQYGQNVSTFPLNPNTPVKVLRRPGQVERITPEMAAAWRAEGFSVVVGPAIIPSKIEIATLSANVLNTPGPNGETFSMDRAGSGGALHALSDRFYKGGQFMPPPDSLGSRKAKKELQKFETFKSPDMVAPLRNGDKWMARVIPLYSGEWAKRPVVFAKFNNESDAIDAVHEAQFQLNERLGIPRATPADASNVVQMPDGARLVGPTTFSIRAFHGTPHKVDRFRTDKIGTGEGAQAYGWGLYFAQGKAVAEQYRDTLGTKTSYDGVSYDNSNPRHVASSMADATNIPTAIERAQSLLELDGTGPRGKLLRAVIKALRENNFAKREVQSTGNLYTVELLPDEDQFLDWDKPLSEQSEKVQKAIRDYLPSSTSALKGRADLGEFEGQRIYTWISNSGDPAERSKALAKAGIPGIRYLDGGSRGAGDGTRNYVIFDENLVRILEENGKPVGETFSLRSGDFASQPSPGGLSEEVEIRENPKFLAAQEAEDTKEQNRIAARYFRNFLDRVKGRGWQRGDSYHSAFSRAKIIKTGRSRISNSTYFTVLAEPIEQGPTTEAWAEREELSWERDEDTGKLTVTFDVRVSDHEATDSAATHADIEVDVAKVNPVDVPWLDLSDTFFPELSELVEEKYVGNPESSRAAGGTFSLRSGDFASRAAAMFSPFQRSPEARMAIARVAKERAMRLGAEWIEKAAVIRSASSINREVAFREADGFDRRMTAYLDSLTPNARQNLEFEPASLEDDPLISAMLDFGKLMSRSTAIKNGVQNMDEFEGAPWLPPAWYSKGSGITPGKMAKAMHEGADGNGGPLAAGDSAADLWDAVASRIESSRKDKAAYREAVQAFRDAKKTARTEAKTEAEAWGERTKKTAGSPKAQRDMLKAALRTLDGILSAAPPEVRARVGGYVKLAGLATDEAMLQEIERRVAKLNVELEKWLKKEARAQLVKVFKKAAPKTESGEKAKGKLTPELHAWFSMAEDASELSPAVADERIEGIENTLSGEMTKAIKEDLSKWLGREITDDAEARDWQEQRLTILQTFGSVLHGTDAKAARGSAEVTAALDLAREAYSQGRLAHIEETAKKRERRAAERLDGITRVGSPYDASKANARRRELNKIAGLKGRAADYLDTGLDASGFFLDLLGKGDLYENVRRGVLGADMAKDDGMRKRKAEFAEMLKGAFPGRGLTARLRGLWELQQIQESAAGTMSQLQMMQLTLWWMDEDSRDWLDSHGYGQDWQGIAEGLLTTEARAVRSWLMKQYAEQYARINPVFRRLRGVNLPRVEVYGGMRQVEHSKSDSSVALEEDMMRGGMQSGFTKTRVSRPSGPPKMTDALQNYWQNAHQVEHYIAFAEVSTELRAIFGHRDFRLAVETNRGQDKARQVSDYIENIEQAGTRDSFAHSAQGRLFGRYGRAVAATALLFKLSVIAKQAPAAIQSAFKVGLKEYFVSLGRIMSGNGAISLGEMYRSDTVQRRLSEHDAEMNQAAKGWNQRHFENEILDKAATTPDLMMNAGWYAIGWTDARFTTISAAVAYDVAFRDAKGMGMNDEDAKTYAADESALIVMETAQPQTAATKSLFENQTPMALLRFLFAFQSANRQVFGLTWLALKKGGVANAWGTAAIIAGMAQTIGGLLRMMTTDDEPEELFRPEVYALAMATAPMTGMMGLGVIVEAINAGVGVESRIAASPAAMAASAIKQMAEGEADVKDVERVMTILGTALGGRGAAVGATWNVLNQIMGLYENATASD